MDSEFYIDDFGRPQARLAMGFEAIADYLNTECRTEQACEKLFSQLKQHQQQRFGQTAIEGYEFTLQLNDDEISIAHQSHCEHDWQADPVEEDMALYDQESHSACGLIDFMALVELWHTFLAHKK